MNTIGLLTVNITDVLHFIRETEMVFLLACSQMSRKIRQKRLQFLHSTYTKGKPVKLAATLRGSRPGVQSASPKTPKNTSFRGHPPGVAQPLYSRGHNETQTYIICPSLIKIGSKTAEKNCTSKQTNQQTNRDYENNGHLAMNQNYEDQ